MNDLEYSFVKHKIVELIGVDLNCYKSQQMIRRLGVYLKRTGYRSWPSLFRAIKDNPEELGKLKDYLTINVSSFFRDPDRFSFLRESVLPELLRGRDRLRVWSAGCSRGHEPYSLAILLSELTGHVHHSIRATDIDSSALAHAKAGGPYAATDLINLPPYLRNRYFRADGDQYYVEDNLRRSVSFQHHNLLADPFGHGFDLIVCRNVVIYFESDTKAQLYRRFHDALRLGGMLFLGGTEVVSRPNNIGFDLLNVSFYRRNSPRAALAAD